jgi:hypothetical protein
MVNLPIFAYEWTLYDMRQSDEVLVKLYLTSFMAWLPERVEMSAPTILGEGGATCRAVLADCRVRHHWLLMHQHLLGLLESLAHVTTVISSIKLVLFGSTRLDTAIHAAVLRMNALYLFDPRGISTRSDMTQRRSQLIRKRLIVSRKSADYCTKDLISNQGIVAAVWHLITALKCRGKTVYHVVSNQYIGYLLHGIL